MNIDDTLFQRLAQELQSQLDAQFRKNISFFRKNAPEIANKFQNFVPTKVKLKLFREGYLNLVNTTLNDKPVYSYDPQQFCQDYIDQYIKRPNFYKVKRKKAKVLDEENIAHVSTVNRCVDILDEYPHRSSTASIEPTTNFLLLNGIGMGYLIPQLLEHTDIKNMVIIEPHLDIFHASLHILDWQQVYAHFEQKNHSLRLIIGETTGATIENLRKHLNRIGMHNAANTFVIDHLNSKEMTEIIKVFLERVAMYFTAAGYFDDEQVSIAHTIRNWRSRISPLREHASETKNFLSYPVFIVGNGPSLDDAKDFLLENQQKAIIISCGTTIGSLRKIGIKPDFHIEMERTRPVVEWLTASTDKEYRKDVILLALNTVHPEVFEMFDTKGMGMKVNDLGTHFFSQYIPEGKHVINFAYCNPTVGNAGLAFASALGFKDVYLFGLDLGFSAGEQHHSKLSTHYRVKEKYVKGLHLYEKEDLGNKEVPANFGGTVMSTPVYISARHSFEQCLRVNPQITCYNTSNGILIDRAKPTRFDEITLKDCIADKGTLSKDLFDRHFFTDDLIELACQEDINKQFQPAVQALSELRNMFIDPIEDWDQAQDLLGKQHDFALLLGLNNTSQYAFTLLRGSIYTFNINLNHALYVGESREEGLEVFNKIRALYIEFIDKATQKIHDELFDLDQKSRNLSSKVSP